MYTLEQLQRKTLKELKEIGWQLSVLPDGDRRCCQNWIDALVGVNPPLLELLEVSPGAEVESVAEPIAIQELLEVLPAVQVQPVSEAIAPVERSTAKRSFESLDTAKFRELTFFELLELCRDTVKDLPNKSLGQLQNLRLKTFRFLEYPLNRFDFRGNKRHRATWIEQIDSELRFMVQMRSMAKVPRGLGRLEFSLFWDRPYKDYDALLLHLFPEAKDVSEAIESQRQEPIEVQRQEPIEVQRQEPIASAAENSPGVSRKTSTAHQLLELFKSSVFIIDSPAGEIESQLSQSAIGLGVFELVPEPPDPLNFARSMSFLDAMHAYYKRYPYWKYRDGRCKFNTEIFLGTEIDPEIDDSPAGETEPELSQSAIAPATENLLDVEADRPPISTGITFSDRFLARYSPPPSEKIHYQADTNGQLSLLYFEIELTDEPPDPDDFESLDAFREAMAVWDSEHCQPCSEHCGFSSVHNEPLSVLLTSLDSMCEWAPCPDDWYEPSSVSELSPTPKSSSTCNFSIPVFDDWCDRANRQNDTDEPPDTGIFARLPKPKPPSFPPQAIESIELADTAKKCFNANRHITHLAAGSSNQSGRSPPGGDAVF